MKRRTLSSSFFYGFKRSYPIIQKKIFKHPKEDSQSFKRRFPIIQKKIFSDSKAALYGFKGGFIRIHKTDRGVEWQVYYSTPQWFGPFGSSIGHVWHDLQALQHALEHHFGAYLTVGSLGNNEAMVTLNDVVGDNQAASNRQAMHEIAIVCPTHVLAINGP